MTYLLVKTIHICAVIFLIGGLLLQCIVLAARHKLSIPFVPTVPTVLMEESGYKLMHSWERRITLPAMFLTWISGLFIASHGGWLGNNWLSVKLAFVVLLTALHSVFSGLLRNHRTSASVFFQYVPGYALPCLITVTAIIVFLVTVKPF